MPGLFHRFSNQAVTYLSDAVNSSTTSIGVVATSAFPHAPFEVTCDSEIMRVVSLNTTTNVLTVLRGAEGSTASSHSAGAPIAHTVTRDGLLDVLANNGVSNATLSFSATDPDAQGGQTVYLTPLKGNNIAIYDANENRWRRCPINVSPFVSANEAAGSCVDVFASWNNSTQQVVLNKVTWVCDDGRPSGYSLVRVDGVTVSESATGWRHVGSYQMVSSTQVAIASNTPVLSGIQENEIPRLGKKIVRIAPPISGYEIHGVEPAEDGSTIYLFNVSSSDTVLLKHDSLSAGANAKLLVLDALDYPIYPLGGVTLIYDSVAGAYRVIGACCTSTTTTAAPTTTTTTVSPGSTTTTASPGSTTTTASPGSTTTTASPGSTTTTTTTPSPFPVTCLPELCYVRNSSGTNGIATDHFEFSNDGSSWYIISSSSPKYVSNKTYTFRLQNTSAHPFRVFDSEGFSRLTKTVTGGATGTVADGFWAGDVTMTITLNDKVPLSYECSIDGFAGGVGESSILYSGGCTKCAQPIMYLRLNEDPATRIPPPIWPSSVPILQWRKDLAPVSNVINGISLLNSTVQVSGMHGSVSGIKVKIYGFTSGSSSSSILLQRDGTEKLFLLAGSINASSITSSLFDYVITPDDSLSLFGFGASGEYKPNPNGNLSTSYSVGSPTHLQLIDALGLDPNTYWTLHVIGGVVNSFSIEILTTTGESLTFWRRPTNNVGGSAIDAHEMVADVPVPSTINNSISENFGSIAPSQVKYVRFRSEYDSNYYLWAGAPNVGGVKLEIFRNWDASGSPSTTYTNLYDSARKRLQCEGGEFIVFKFTNTSTTTKTIKLKLQTPGIHYELSADEVNWHDPNWYSFGGYSPTSVAQYNINLKYLVNSRFAVRIATGTLISGSTANVISSESQQYYYGNNSGTPIENDYISVAMGSSESTPKYLQSLTGTLTFVDDGSDADKQSLVYGASCVGLTPGSCSGTSRWSWAGSDWVLLSSNCPPGCLPQKPDFTPSGYSPTNELGSCSGQFTTTTITPGSTTTTTTTASPYPAGYYCLTENAYTANANRYCTYSDRLPEGATNEGGGYWIILSRNIFFTGPYSTLSACSSLCFFPTTTSTTTTTPAGTTTASPCSGYCVYEWNGSGWVAVYSSCSSGCGCSQAPTTPGSTVGQTSTKTCISTTAAPTTTTTSTSTTAAPTTTTTSTSTTAAPTTTTTSTSTTAAPTTTVTSTTTTSMYGSSTTTAAPTTTTTASP